MLAAVCEEPEPFLIQRPWQEASFIREGKCVIQNESHLALINEAKLHSLAPHQETTPAPPDRELPNLFSVTIRPYNHSKRRELEEVGSIIGLIRI